MDPSKPSETPDEPIATAPWRAALVNRPWSEATRELRRNRRPHGWQSTPRRLVERAVSGDRRAVAALCKRYREPVRRYLQLQPNTARWLAEEATQEFFVGLVRCDEARNDFAALHLNPESSFGAWLAAGARHALSNLRRREKRYTRLAVRVGGEALEVARAARSLDSLVEEDRVFALLEQAFTRLGREYERKGHGRLFDHLRSTLLGFTPKLTDTELGRLLRPTTEGASYVSQARWRMKWIELPRVWRELTKQRAPSALCRTAPAAGPR